MCASYDWGNQPMTVEEFQAWFDENVFDHINAEAPEEEFVGMPSDPEMDKSALEAVPYDPVAAEAEKQAKLEKDSLNLIKAWFEAKPSFCD